MFDYQEYMGCARLLRSLLSYFISMVYISLNYHQLFLSLKRILD